MSELKTTQEIWDLRFLKLVQEISTWSKDPSTKVGCVIVNAERRPVSFGYNGFPRGIPDQIEILNDREQKYKRVLHAEQNAILFASTKDLTGCTVYITHCPCSQCVASLIQLNIARVVAIEQPDFEQRWKTDVVLTLELLRLAEIPYKFYRLPGDYQMISCKTCYHRNTSISYDDIVRYSCTHPKKPKLHKVNFIDDTIILDPALRTPLWCPLKNNTVLEEYRHELFV